MQFFNQSGNTAMSYGWGWRPYVSVASRRAKGQRYAASLAKKGRKLLPVTIDGRTIARTFWGKAWCDNLESYSDFENRLPRGRTYARNGSVIDLQIKRGKVTAIVSGSEIYEVKIDIAPLEKSDWKTIKQDCSQAIDSLIDLLQGRFSKGVMERLTRQSGGLFPKPKEISLRCSCPDWAVLCKHAAAALYGVGARLDDQPEMLFLLRDVDHLELIGEAARSANLDAALTPSQAGSLQSEDLGELFGIDIEKKDSEVPKRPKPRVAAKRAASAASRNGRSDSSAAQPADGKRAKKTKPAVRKASGSKVAATASKKQSAKKKAATPQKASAAKKRRQTTSVVKARKAK
jgi:uncharacterized Zn finger protein